MLNSKGRYYELPLAGSRIHKLIYNGVLRLVFDDSDEAYLDLIGRFGVKRYGQTTTLLPKSSETLLLFYDLFHAEAVVREAKADKDGRLFLVFSDNTEVSVAEDSQYWEFTRHSKQHPNTNVSVSGGLGYLDF